MVGDFQVALAKADIAQGLRTNHFRQRERLEPVVEFARSLGLADAVVACSVTPLSRFNCFATGTDKRRGRGRRSHYFLVPDGGGEQAQLQLQFGSVQHLAHLNMGRHVPTVLTIKLDPGQLQKQCVHAWRAGAMGKLSIDVKGPLSLALLDAAHDKLSVQDELVLLDNDAQLAKDLKALGILLN